MLQKRLASGNLFKIYVLILALVLCNLVSVYFVYAETGASGEPGGLDDPFAASGSNNTPPSSPQVGGSNNSPPTPSYTGGGSDQKFDNPLGNTTTVQAFISKLLGIVVQIAIPIAIFFIVYAGFLLTTARGNEEQLKRGKAALLWALVGSAVILAAQLLSEVIKNTINNL